MIHEESLNFDPVKDVAEVDQFGYIDLVTAFQNGSIPSNINLKDLEFNQIGDPSSILGTPKDIFDAHRLAAEYSERAKAVAADQAAAQSSKTAPPTTGEAK